MSFWILGAIAFSVITALALAFYFVLKRIIDRTSAIPSLGTSDPKPCYRCAAEAVGTYMGISYCFMCREVVMVMMRGVAHDPPFGFPGAPGYLDYPKEMLKETKETDHG